MAIVLRHVRGAKTRSADHWRMSVSSIGHEKGIRSISTRGSTCSSSDRSAPVKLMNVSREAVSTVTSKPCSTKPFAVASAR